MAFDWRKLVPQQISYVLVALFCLLLSIASLLFAVFVSHEKEDAGRGGAVAILVALGVLFLRKTYGERVYLSILELSPSIKNKLQEDEDDDTRPIEDFSTSEMSTILRGMIGRMNFEADRQDIQDRWLFCATLIGTVFSAFGDRFFRQLSTFLSLPR